MPRYEWTGSGTFSDNRNGRDVEPGDVVELDEHVGEPQPQFVRVDDGADDSDEPADESDDADAESEAAADAPIDPTDLTIPELEDALEDGDYSGGELITIAEAEKADGSPRSGALDVIDAYR